MPPQTVSPLREIFVVHHSHTDWGYTTHQSHIGELHCRYIDEAVALCRRHRAFRWTCESAWVAHQYLRTRSVRQRAAFRDGVERGQLEVAGLPLHPTPLANRATMDAALRLLDDLRAAGIPITVALACDINGLSWPWADALLDAGITGLGLAMNFVCGGGLPRWTAFHWRAPSGRALLCWQGTHYNQGAYWGLNHDVYPIEQVAPRRIRELRDYPRAKVLLQVSNIPCDNMGPHPRHLDYVRRYNRLARARGFPRMRPALLREWFEYLAGTGEAFPVYRGDWTDWWASGIASTPRETAALCEAQRRADLAARLGAHQDAVSSARRKIFLAAEHTWGDNASVHTPWKPAAVAGLAGKQTLMYEAAYAATDLLRGALPSGRVMFDPQLEGFDPHWAALADGQRRAETVRALCPRYRPGPRVDWARRLPATAPRVILEAPADGQRSTWYEAGRFNRPEAHGRWPVRPRWQRRVCRSATIERRVEGDTLRVEVRVTLPVTTAPRALYIEFPLRLTASGVWADVGGAWADPRAANVPGGCVNWWTVHQGVLLTSARGSVLWTPWDAPLVMFDAICPGPPKARNTLAPPRLISWALHTYWTTNFAAISGGEYRFRYRLKFWPRLVTPAEAERYCASDPLADPPQIARAQGKQLPAVVDRTRSR